MRSWNLFLLLVWVDAAILLVSVPFADLNTLAGVQFMIKQAIRCSTPLFLATFTASSLVRLWPNSTTKWILKNRKYFGLAFAVAFTWHGFFNIWAWIAHTAAYTPRYVGLFTLITGVTGYGSLYALSATSFRTFSRYLSAAQWRAVHLIGMYTLWLLLAAGYSSSLQDTGHAIYYVAVSLMFAALLLRIAAWWKRRSLSSRPRGVRYIQPSS